jgi:hypothetical protein
MAPDFSLQSDDFATDPYYYEYNGYQDLGEGDCTVFTTDVVDADTPAGSQYWADQVIQQVNASNPQGLINAFMGYSALAGVTSGYEYIAAAAGFADGANAANAIMLGSAPFVSDGVVYSGYVEIGGVLGADTLNMPLSQWLALGQNGQQAAMAGFIDQAIANGNQIIFTSNPALAAAGTGTAFEYGYLVDLGYSVVQQGTSWVVEQGSALGQFLSQARSAGPAAQIAPRGTAIRSTIPFR